MDEIGNAITDPRHKFLWEEIIKFSHKGNQAKGVWFGRKCFIELIELNPEALEIKGVLELYTEIKSDMKSYTKTQMNKANIKRATRQNKKMEVSGKRYIESESKELNTSINKLKAKHH